MELYELGQEIQATNYKSHSNHTTQLKIDLLTHNFSMKFLHNNK